jgi:hypothetical protein
MGKAFAKVFLVAGLLLTIAACEKKNCNKVTCPLGLECYEGQCICQDGYEGTNCATISRDKYVGYYLVSEVCQGSLYNFSPYTTTIDSAPYTSPVNYITINDLFNQGPAVAYIVNSPGNMGNNIMVPQQNLGAITFSGQGNFYPQNSSIVINFNYTLNGGSYSCTHTFNRQ